MVFIVFIFRAPKWRLSRSMCRLTKSTATSTKAKGRKSLSLRSNRAAKSISFEKGHGDEIAQYGLHVDIDRPHLVRSQQNSENVPTKYVTIDDHESGRSEEEAEGEIIRCYPRSMWRWTNLLETNSLKGAGDYDERLFGEALKGQDTREWK